MPLNVCIKPNVYNVGLNSGSRKLTLRNRPGAPVTRSVALETSLSGVMALAPASRDKGVLRKGQFRFKYNILRTTMKFKIGKYNII